MTVPMNIVVITVVAVAVGWFYMGWQARGWWMAIRGETVSADGATGEGGRA